MDRHCSRSPRSLPTRKVRQPTNLSSEYTFHMLTTVDRKHQPQSSVYLPSALSVSGGERRRPMPELASLSTRNTFISSLLAGSGAGVDRENIFHVIFVSFHIFFLLSLPKIPHLTHGKPFFCIPKFSPSDTSRAGQPVDRNCFHRK
jgi:hypothetical protein